MCFLTKINLSKNNLNKHIKKTFILKNKLEQTNRLSMS